MGDFDRNAGRRSSGRGRFDGGRSGGFSGRGRGRDRDEGRDRGRSGGFGGRDRPERHEMHSATCDKCGNECEVPFKPTQGKPLYCNDCFKDKNKEAGSRSEFGKTNNNGNLDQINEKLNKILKILEGHVKEDKPAKETKEKPKKETKEKPKKIEKEEPKLEYAENIEEKNPKKKKAKKKK